MSSITHLTKALLIVGFAFEVYASAVIGRDERLGTGNSFKNIDRRTTAPDSATDGPTVISASLSSIATIDVSYEINTTAHQRRASTSRKIDTCPDPEDPYFVKSACDHNGGSPNAKSFKVTCNYRPTSSPQYRSINDNDTPGTCGPEEFCVQNDNNPEADSVAYCVSHENVVDLVQAGASPARSARQVSVDTDKWAKDPAGNTLDAIMLTPDEGQIVQADSISVTALAKDTINGQDSYRAQIEGTAACSACSSLQLPKVPDHTARLRWDISFTGVTSGAILVPTLFQAT